MGIQVFQNQEEMDDSFEEMMDAAAEKEQLMDSIHSKMAEIEDFESDLASAKLELKILHEEMEVFEN